MDIFIPLFAIAILFIGLPWLIFHYVTKWKQSATITMEDENLLDELHDIARRLDERMTSIERIIAVDRDKSMITELKPHRQTAIGEELDISLAAESLRRNRKREI